MCRAIPAALSKAFHPSILQNLPSLRAQAALCWAGDVILFPSPLGSLNITTLGGGAFQSQEYADYLKALVDYNPAPE